MSYRSTQRCVARHASRASTRPERPAGPNEDDRLPTTLTTSSGPAAAPSVVVREQVHLLRRDARVRRALGRGDSAAARTPPAARTAARRTALYTAARAAAARRGGC
eukprot:CAMPEP_0195652568 /NCGR_PEP_ID=MMETSP0815-20121206/32902_1 /TAXON_ID=97485 /ORGANISM="Prymnesium parvum, Strain Texoma1" /LENGTH=105 /DNA_ID=CAMNT_0040796613 /DNA_START=141 /DNA_END=456 /DNA_ORIENTATION=-